MKNSNYGKNGKNVALAPNNSFRLFEQKHYANEEITHMYCTIRSFITYKFANFKTMRKNYMRRHLENKLKEAGKTK